MVFFCWIPAVTVHVSTLMTWKFEALITQQFHFKCQRRWPLISMWTGRNVKFNNTALKTLSLTYKDTLCSIQKKTHMNCKLCLFLPLQQTYILISWLSRFNTPRYKYFISKICSSVSVWARCQKQWHNRNLIWIRFDVNKATARPRRSLHNPAVPEAAPGWTR